MIATLLAIFGCGNIACWTKFHIFAPLKAKKESKGNMNMVYMVDHDVMTLDSFPMEGN